MFDGGIQICIAIEVGDNWDDDECVDHLIWLCSDYVKNMKSMECWNASTSNDRIGHDNI
jgi:hypothetical protein